MIFFALSNMVESTLRCDSESFGVGNLPLRSASSVKILVSSPQSSGDVLIVIAIIRSFYLDYKYTTNYLHFQPDGLIIIVFSLSPQVNPAAGGKVRI